MHQPSHPPNGPGLVRSDRRGFFKKALTIVLGLAGMVVPVVSGLMVVFDPLRRKVGQRAAIRVTSLNSVPEDGLPRKFVVVSDQSDAWNHNPSVPVGAVYLRRTGAKSVQAFNVVCPHAGCFVDFVAARRSYLCPCHNSAFGLDGNITDPKSPSPRGLDELEVEIRNETEVWVHFQNFLAGHERKMPIA
jgi:menaquinol-cytochrome c reductase iron-sulfur subunit